MGLQRARYLDCAWLSLGIESLVTKDSYWDPYAPGMFFEFPSKSKLVYDIHTCCHSFSMIQVIALSIEHDERKCRK